LSVMSLERRFGSLMLRQQHSQVCPGFLLMGICTH